MKITHRDLERLPLRRSPAALVEADLLISGTPSPTVSLSPTADVSSGPARTSGRSTQKPYPEPGCRLSISIDQDYVHPGETITGNVAMQTNHLLSPTICPNVTILSLRPDGGFNWRYEPKEKDCGKILTFTVSAAGAKKVSAAVPVVKVTLTDAFRAICINQTLPIQYSIEPANVTILAQMTGVNRARFSDGRIKKRISNTGSLEITALTLSSRVGDACLKCG